VRPGCTPYVFHPKEAEGDSDWARMVRRMLEDGRAILSEPLTEEDVREMFSRIEAMQFEMFYPREGEKP
jgi:hypothetical protein